MTRARMLTGAALALLLAGPALADKYEGQPVPTSPTSNKGGDPSTYSDGPGGLYHVNGPAPGPYVTLSNPPQGALVYWPSVIQSSTISKQLADSSATYPFPGCTRLVVAVYPTFDDSTGAELMGLRLRWHTVGVHDSLTTYESAWQRAPRASATSTAVAGVLAASGNTNLHTAASAASLGLFSSVAVGSIVSGPGIAAGTVVTAKGTGDSTLTISPGTTATFAASTITFWPAGNSGAALDSLGSLAWIAQKANAFSRTAGQCYQDEYPLPMVPLGGAAATRGRFYLFDMPGGPYASVIMRAVACYDASGAAYATNSEPHVTYRVDLYGYR